MNIQQLRERYAEPEIPKCRVCGGELTIQRAGGGPTIWGCTGMIDDPTGERNWVYAEGRECGDEHYGRSRWSDYRQGGDADVIELIDTLEAAEEEIARRDAAACEPVAWISERNLKILGKAFSVVVKHEPVMVRPVALYTSAPPAVLPPEKITEIMQDSWNEFCDDTGCYPDDFEYQNEQLFFDAGRWAMLVAERISSLGAQPQKPAPDGWKLVPVIPTWGMLSSDGCSKHHNGQECSHHENRKRIWSAMLAAAPAPGGDVE